MNLKDDELQERVLQCKEYELPITEVDCMIHNFAGSHNLKPCPIIKGGHITSNNNLSPRSRLGVQKWIA